MTEKGDAMDKINILKFVATGFSGFVWGGILAIAFVSLIIIMYRRPPKAGKGFNFLNEPEDESVYDDGAVIDGVNKQNSEME